MPFYDRKDDFMYIRWAREIKQRDHYTCTLCGKRGVELNAHHLNAWASFKDERYDLDNGTTLCFYCHNSYHLTYGKGKNTKEEFEEFVKLMESFQIEAKYQLRLESSSKKIIKYLEVEDVVSDIIKELNGEEFTENDDEEDLSLIDGYQERKLE